jgi:hypothetical protein
MQSSSRSSGRGVVKVKVEVAAGLPYIMLRSLSSPKQADHTLFRVSLAM